MLRNDWKLLSARSTTSSVCAGVKYENVSISAPVEGFTVAKPEAFMMTPFASCFSRSLTTERHHGPSHDVAVPQQVELFVDLVERACLEGVTDLALGHKRQNFADVGVVAPERAAENLFARHPREEWNIDPVADQTHVDVLAANRQQAERQLDHRLGAGAVDDRVEVGLARSVLELGGHSGGGFAPGANDVVGPVFLGDRELLRISSDRDYLRTATETLGILDRI